MRKLLPCYILVLLTACSGSDYWWGKEKKLELEGERIAIFTEKSSVEVSSRNKVSIASAEASENWHVGSLPIDFNDISNVSYEISEKEKFSIYIDTDKTFGHASSAVISDGKLFIWNYGKINAYNTVTGEKIWTSANLANIDSWSLFADKKYQSGGLSVYNGVVYATNGLSDLIALDANNGIKLWDVSFNATIRSNPIIVANTIVVQTLNGIVYGVSSSDGRLIWSNFAIDDKLSTLASPTATSYQGNAIIQYQSGDLVALNAKTGEELWMVPLSEGVEVLSTKFHLQNFVGHPTIYKNQLFAYGADGILGCLNLNMNEVKWQKKLDITKPFWISGNALFAISRDAYLIAVDLADGSVFWKVDLKIFADSKNKKIFNSPILINGMVVVVDSDGHLYSFDPVNGELKSKNEVISGVKNSPVATSDGVYLLNVNGNLVRY